MICALNAVADETNDKYSAFQMNILHLLCLIRFIMPY